MDKEIKAEIERMISEQLEEKIKREIDELIAAKLDEEFERRFQTDCPGTERLSHD